MSSNKSITLHIPLDRIVRDRLDARAKRLGFDSVQAYIRVWAKADAEGRTLDFGDDWGEPSPEAAARLRSWSKEAQEMSAAGKLPSFTSVDEMMDYLTNGEAD